MKQITTTQSIGQTILTPSVRDSTLRHQARVKENLRRVRLSNFALRRSESKHLPHIIHFDEEIGGAVYGKHSDGYVMMVATDRRLLFIDKKPLFLNTEEISYDFVSGVSFGSTWFMASITLHTRLKDYTIQTFNKDAAAIFTEFIETRCVERLGRQ